MPLAARLVEVVSPRDIRDQVGRPYCQEHEDHGRIDYWSGGEAKEARACSDHDKLEPAPPKKTRTRRSFRPPPGSYGGPRRERRALPPSVHYMPKPWQPLNLLVAAEQALASGRS
jgi:hypothetical protein